MEKTTSSPLQGFGQWLNNAIKTVTGTQSAVSPLPGPNTLMRNIKPQNAVQPMVAPMRQPIAPSPQATPTSIPPLQRFAPVARAAAPSPSPTPVPSNPNQALIDAYKKGFEYYGNPPAATLAAQMVEESQKYPIFKKFPFLPAAISILESGGGKNMSDKQKPYNMTSWGINLPKGYFNPSSVNEVVSKTISGVGQRTPAFQKFRDTGNLNDLADVYAPKSDNPQDGGNVYATRAQGIMDNFNKNLSR